MSNSKLSNIDFVVLDISEKNYFPWTLDAEIHLTAKELGETIKPENTVSAQARAKAMIFLRHHLHEDLKKEYLTVKDPLILWQSLKERFDHQKQVILPKARYDWMHLRLQDFKSVSEYNSAMFSITSKLIYNSIENVSHGREHGNNSGNERGRGRGRRRNTVWHRDGYNPKPYDFKKKVNKGKKMQHQAPKNSGNACNRCGMKNHLAKQCRTSRHFVDLYQASLKKKGKYIETNFIDNFNDDEPNPNVRFDSSDFFDDVEDVDIKSILGNSEDECLVDSGTTNTVLKNIKYFYEFHIANANVNTICGTSNLIESSGKACIVLPKASEIINNEVTVPKSIRECRQRNDWQKWQDAIQAKQDSLEKRQVFGLVSLTPNKVKPVGYKWVFALKRNEKTEIMRYKARLVAKGSKMRLMDVVTTYLYGLTYSDIYMKISEGLKMPEACKSKPREMFSIKLKRSLYGQQQSGRMWYNRLMYVDNLNIIGNLNEIEHTANLLKNEFKMKDHCMSKFCLGLQIEHLSNGIFVHQSNYTDKILKRFNMDKAHPLSSPMVGHSLDRELDPFCPKEHDEDILGPEIPYVSAIGALMYLASNTRPDIAFSVNLLARYSFEPTRRH
ncbi:transposable element [Tanacetum coccineum]